MYLSRVTQLSALGKPCEPWKAGLGKDSVRERLTRQFCQLKKQQTETAIGFCFVLQSKWPLRAPSANRASRPEGNRWK